MGCKFMFTVKFNYDKECEAELKALRRPSICKEIGVTSIDKPVIKNGIAEYPGCMAYHVLNLECILGFFEDYGKDIVVTWSEEDSPDVIESPDVSKYVELAEGNINSARWVFAPCCGRWTAPSCGKKEKIEIFGREALREPWIDIAEGVTFEKFRTDFQISASFPSRSQRSYPITEDMSTFSVDDMREAIGVKILQLGEKIDKRKGSLVLQGVADGELSFMSIIQYLKKYANYICIQWFCKDTPEDAREITVDNNDNTTSLPVFDTPTCGRMFLITQCPAGTTDDTLTSCYSLFGKDECKSWSYVRGLL